MRRNSLKKSEINAILFIPAFLLKLAWGAIKIIWGLIKLLWVPILTVIEITFVLIKKLFFALFKIIKKDKNTIKMKQR